MYRKAIAVLVLAWTTIPASGQSFVNWETPHVHPLDLTPDGTRLLVVNTADNLLEVFDTTGASLVAVAGIPVGLDPVSVRARSNTEAWVVNHVSDSVSIVDLPTGRVVRTLLTGDEPADVVFAGAPLRAFVTLSQLNQVAVYNLANLNAAPTIVPIQGEDPRSLAVSPDGLTVYAGIFESGNHTTIIDQPTVSNPAGPYGGVNPPQNNGTLFSPPRAPGQPPPPPVSQIVRKAADGRWLDDNDRDWSTFVTWDLHDQDLAIINANTLAVSFARGLITTVMGVSVTPSGTVTVIGTEATNELRFEPNVSGIFIRSKIASFEPADINTVTISDLNPHLDYTTSSVPPVLRNLSLGDPRGIVWHPSGALAYITGMGSNNVIATELDGTRLAQIDVGEGPTGLAISSGGDRLFVLNKFDATISTIDTATNSVIETTPFFDPTPEVIRAGRPFLYASHTTSGLGQASCASCHIDGRTDHLAWDLGDPSGNVKIVNQTCRQGAGNCDDWHPMKGPMVTQTLQGIIGNEPLHWRGDREDLAAFAAAFTGLQGADAPPTAEELQQFTDFAATIQYPPNPNRNLDGTLRTNLPTSTGIGSAAIGQNIFVTQPTLPGLTCNACHALPSGSDLTVDDPPVGPPSQTLKVAQLRNMHEKTGFARASLVNNRGFGFEHDGAIDTLFNFLGPPFNFPPGPAGQQQRRDVEAFMLSLSTDTHPAVGQQVTFDGLNNNDATLLNRLNTFVTLANSGLISITAKARRGGLDRGYAYVGGNVMQSDRSSETVTVDTLRTGSALGSECTFTAVPTGSQTRIGIDRDEDGYLDRDELDGCSDPADAASIPPLCCPGDTDCDGALDVADNCPNVINVDQADGDSDGLGDACDSCPTDNANDADDDGHCAADDNCPLVTNPLQEDANGDGIGDACQCPAPLACLDGSACTYDACSGVICVHDSRSYGDVNGSGGAPNLDDILCGIMAFADRATCPNADIAGCTPNNLVNLDDLLAVINAFAGSDPCGCSP